MERLPVYRLDRPVTSAGDLVSAAARVFDITDGFTITEGAGRLSLRRREHVIEQHSDLVQPVRNTECPRQ
jgi:hypothetical protein